MLARLHLLGAAPEATRSSAAPLCPSGTWRCKPDMSRWRLPAVVHGGNHALPAVVRVRPATAQGEPDPTPDPAHPVDGALDHRGQLEQGLFSHQFPPYCAHRSGWGSGPLGGSSACLAGLTRTQNAPLGRPRLCNTASRDVACSQVARSSLPPGRRRSDQLAGVRLRRLGLHRRSDLRAAEQAAVLLSRHDRHCAGPVHL